MASFYPMGGQTYTLQSSISSTQTTITLTSFKVPVSGADITMALMNTSIVYGTIAPRTTQSEFISFTGITQNSDGTATLTGVTRGLNKTYPFTESSSFKLPHAGSTQFILSDVPEVFNKYAAMDNDNTWTGKQTFPASGGASSVLLGVSYVAPTADTEAASKKYVDLVATFGAPNATTTTAGIVQLPTQAQVEAGTQVGSTGAQLALPNVAYGARYFAGYGTGAGGTTTYTTTLTPIPTAYATGMVVGVIMPNQNTGNSTLNVNALGAKTIRLGGTGLFSGVFATNSIVGLQYNGTQFDIIYQSDGPAAAATANHLALRNSTGDVTVNTTPSASTDAASKSYVDNKSVKKIVRTAKDMSSTTSTVLAHGLGVTPTLVTFMVNRETTAGTGITGSLVSSMGSYDGTNQYANYVAVSTTGPNSLSSQDQTKAIHYGYGSNTVDTDTLVGSVTMDATNVTITWTKASAPTGTANIIGLVYA